MSGRKRLVYIGPNIAGLNCGNIFIEDIPYFIRKKLEIIKGYEKLFVEADNLATAQDKLRNKGSGIRLVYNAVIKAKKEGVIK